MAIQLVTISVQELLGIIDDERQNAYATGYVKAKKELELEAAKAHALFNELLKGVKELKRYLEYKAYWKGSINTLYKVAYQLVENDDHQGHGLMFRCTCIDYAFNNGFHFIPPKKKESELR